MASRFIISPSFSQQQSWLVDTLSQLKTVGKGLYADDDNDDGGGAAMKVII